MRASSIAGSTRSRVDEAELDDDVGQEARPGRRAARGCVTPSPRASASALAVASTLVQVAQGLGVMCFELVSASHARLSRIAVERRRQTRPEREAQRALAHQDLQAVDGRAPLLAAPLASSAVPPAR